MPRQPNVRTHVPPRPPGIVLPPCCLGRKCRDGRGGQESNDDDESDSQASLLHAIELSRLLALVLVHVGQKRGEGAEEWQERAQPVHELDPVAIGECAQHCRAEPAHAEGEPEEHA